MKLVGYKIKRPEGYQEYSVSTLWRGFRFWVVPFTRERYLVSYDTFEEAVAFIQECSSSHQPEATFFYDATGRPVA